MYTVYLKGNSLIFQTGFNSWREAHSYGISVYGPKNFEIVDERY